MIPEIKKILGSLQIILFYMWDLPICSAVKLTQFLVCEGQFSPCPMSISEIKIGPSVLVASTLTYRAILWLLFFYNLKIYLCSIKILWKCMHRKIQSIFSFSQSSFPLPQGWQSHFISKFHYLGVKTRKQLKSFELLHEVTYNTSAINELDEK